MRETLRFGLVGGAAFVVDLAAFNLFRLWAGLGPLTSKTLAVVVATTFAYAANRAWTFAGRGGRRERIGVAGEYALFFVLNGCGLLIALACLGVSYYLLGLRSPLAQNISANGVGLVLGTAFRFWSYRRWVFPEQPQAAAYDEEEVDAEEEIDRAA